jgi:two-component system LytT family response regulator
MFHFRVFVADQESLWRRRIRRYLSLEPGCELVGECDTAPEAETVLATLRPDILFLGGQTAGNPEWLGRGPLPVVILTSDHREAAAAFYLAKPFNILQFREMLERAKGRLVRDRLTELYEDMSRRRSFPDRIAVRDRGRVVFVKVAEIDWIQAADNYVCLHCGRVTHTIRETMRDLESRLDPARFPRVHRSAIVNVDRIRELQPWFRGEYRILLLDGTELILSKSHRAKLESLLLGTRIKPMAFGVSA